MAKALIFRVLLDDLILRIADDLDIASMVPFASVDKYAAKKYKGFRADVARMRKFTRYGTIPIVFIINSDKETHYLLKYLIRDFVKDPPGETQLKSSVISLICLDDLMPYYAQFIDKVSMTRSSDLALWNHIIDETINIACFYNKLEHLRYLMTVFGDSLQLEPSHLGIACKHISLDCAKYLSDYFSKSEVSSWMSVLTTELFISLCRSGKYSKSIYGDVSDSFETDFANMIRFILELSSIDIHAHNELSLRLLSSCGHLEAMRVLITYGEESDSRVNIHPRDPYTDPFGSAVSEGNLDVCKYLIELGEGLYGRIDIHYNNDQYMKNCLREATPFSKHLDVCSYLIELSQNGYGPYGKGYLRAYRKLCKVGHKCAKREEKRFKRFRGKRS